MATAIVQIRRKGIITLPVKMRRRYDLDTGDVFTLVDLGDRSFLLTPKVSRTAGLGDKVGRLMAQEGVSLEEMLETLDQEREAYYGEHYARD
ncbi:MAG: AbrB/MazE/SpoVT family DNA-binding domain-containing protein [Chloroflexota bacterium]|nr:AbrB/MazE/SpoVT family DNA-binding domain-containing protein [Chloroflexota bacterium]